MMLAVLSKWNTTEKIGIVCCFFFLMPLMNPYKLTKALREDSYILCATLLDFP